MIVTQCLIPIARRVGVWELWQTSFGNFRMSAVAIVRIHLPHAVHSQQKSQRRIRSTFRTASIVQSVEYISTMGWYSYSVWVTMTIQPFILQKALHGFATDVASTCSSRSASKQSRLHMMQLITVVQTSTM